MHPQRSVITRALGTEADVDVDVFTVEAEDGDVYLLCSDGLTTMVDAGTIAQILRGTAASLDAATHALIKAANDRGGDDNITAILFAVADGDARARRRAARSGTVAADPDDEDTLHPEDNVRLPDASPRTAAEVTMVVSAAELARALESQPPAPAAPTRCAGAVPVPPPDLDHRRRRRPARGVPEPDPMQLPYRSPRQSRSARCPRRRRPANRATRTQSRRREPRRCASRSRCLVIVALAVAIILLVLNALPQMTERNRELGYLAAVGALTGLGFASVYIARQAVIGWGSLTYAAFFIGALPRRAHRRAASRCRTPTRTSCR